jgi:hypothetical protein
VLAALPPGLARIVDGGHHSARKFADNWKDTLSKARLLRTRKIAKTGEKMVDKLESSLLLARPATLCVGSLTPRETAGRAPIQ